MISNSSYFYLLDVQILWHPVTLNFKTFWRWINHWKIFFDYCIDYNIPLNEGDQLLIVWDPLYPQYNAGGWSQYMRSPLVGHAVIASVYLVWNHWNLLFVKLYKLKQNKEYKFSEQKIRIKAEEHIYPKQPSHMGPMWASCGYVGIWWDIGHQKNIVLLLMRTVVWSLRSGLWSVMSTTCSHVG